MRIKVLTPLHIGSGSQLAPIDYRYRDGKIRVIDYEEAFMNDERLRSMIESGNLDPELAEDYFKYEVDSCRLTGKEKILEHIKVAGRPYVPGSSLKGLVRTAVLWKYLKERGRVVRNPNELRRVEKELFGDPHRDVMRFITFRDSKPADVRSLAVYEIAVMTERRRGDALRLEPKNFRIYAECLKPGAEVEMEVFTKTKLDKLEDRLRSIIRGWDEKKEYVENWKAIVTEFSKHVVEVEREFFSHRNGREFDDVLKFLDTIERRIEEGRTVFRLGFSTGWLWKTVGSLLSRDDRVRVAGTLRLNRGRRGEDFPKTRRVVMSNEKRYLPGWIEIYD